MLDAVISLQFSMVETLRRHFWSSDNNNEGIDEKRIFPFVRTFVFFITGTVANFYYYVCFDSRTKLNVLSRYELVLTFVDYQFY